MENILEPVTLADWQKVLEDLGFEHKYYNYLDCKLVGVDWYNGEEHIETHTNHTKEYDKYLEGLPEGTEFNTDWNQCIVNSITIDTDEFAYPEVYIRDSNGWKGYIDLNKNNQYNNFSPLTLNYFNKALWMSRHPIQAKNNILKKFLSECDIFFSKFKDMLTKLDYKEKYNCLLRVGEELHETEPYIAFSHCNSYKLVTAEFYFNMFTERLIYVKEIPHETKYTGPDLYQINVNDMTVEELEKELRADLEYWDIKIN